MEFREIIRARRNGLVHSRAEFDFLAKGATGGTIPDYQLAAWLMAAVLKPLTFQETADLTLAMAESGERLDLSALPRPWVDKHSTGGVGDKTSIILLPLLASCGITMVKMSGRGLGITGGTVDKLESIPGFRMNLEPSEMIAQARRIGVAITGQTPKLAPADKVLYALRDATETVDSMPLIASSILSKKIAGGAETIVIDLKCGSGAFMKTMDEARELATLMLEVANRCGVRLKIAITDMDQPLGKAVGNQLEVAEAIDVLAGEGESLRLGELCIGLAGIALNAAGKAQSIDEGKSMAKRAIESGMALDKAREWFEAQGASKDAFVGRRLALDSPPVVIGWNYDGDPAWVQRLDAASFGEAALMLGAGRRTKEDRIDGRVGIELGAGIAVGSKVCSGDEILKVYAADSESAAHALSMLHTAVQFTLEPVASRSVFLEVL